MMRHVLPATPEAWSVTVPGVPVPFDLTLQGFVLTSVVPADNARTNAIAISVR